jgi:hypothetical protein
MTESDRVMAEWCRETWRTGTEIEIAEHQVRVQLEQEALLRVAGAREARIFPPWSAAPGPPAAPPGKPRSLGHGLTAPR